MQSLTQLFDKQLESPSLEKVLEDCSKEGIPESELSDLLSKYLRKIQAKKRTEEYWEKVRKSGEPKELTSAQMFDRFLEIYQVRFGREFELDKYSEPLVKILCQYFVGDPEFEKDGRSLQKGIFLYGNVGCGKSSIMQTFTQNQRQGFRMINCINVAVEFSKHGYDGLNQFVRSNGQGVAMQQNFGQSSLTWCFDDLGIETEKKHFGNEVNVIGEVIQMIYDQKRLIGNIHFTTNLGADQVLQVYGRRVASRLHEMVNILEFDTNSPDRRS